MNTDMGGVSVISDGLGLVPERAGFSLLSCPFCGATPRLVSGPGVWREHHKIKCGTPNCYGNPQAAKTWATPDQAAAEWNSRPTENSIFGKARPAITVEKWPKI